MTQDEVRSGSRVQPSARPTSDRGSRRDAEVLLAAAAHELRTPIATVCGLVELLRAREQHPAGADREAMWDVLWRQSLRLGALVEDLLDVSHLDGRPASSSKVIPLERAIADALETAPPPGPITVTVAVTALPDGSPLSVRLEPNSLPRVLVNLLTNAYRYAATVVSVSASRRGPYVTLTINDDGPGVPVEIETTMFDRYTRGTNSDGHHGLGIGLALAQQIVDDAGGRLSYERREPRGSAFVIELPFVHAGGDGKRSTIGGHLSSVDRRVID